MEETFRTRIPLRILNVAKMVGLFASLITSFMIVVRFMVGQKGQTQPFSTARVQSALLDRGDNEESTSCVQLNAADSALNVAERSMVTTVIVTIGKGKYFLN